MLENACENVRMVLKKVTGKVSGLTSALIF